jgi:hypothetical protein
MWGEVTPAERLRSVTRRHADDERLAAEAADALAGFADEPASLVVACRRVIAHHATHAPLWWVCARILAAPEPRVAARDAVRALEADRTADRLGATLPLLDEGEVIAVIGWPAAVDEAMIERFDLDVVAVRVDGVDPTPALRRRRSDHPVRVVESWDPSLAQVPRLLVGAAAIGPERAVVPTGTRDALAAITANETWLVGGAGRVLPRPLYDALASSVGRADADEEITLTLFDRIAGPKGVERVHDAVSRVDCPIVPKLLRRADDVSEH